MITDLFHKAKQIFGDAMDLPPAQRESFIVRACGGDAILLEEARALLAIRTQSMDRFLEMSGNGGPVVTLDSNPAGERPATESGTYAVTPAPVPEPTTGAVLSERYELGERLGEGAFGAVYRAKDRLSQQDVAVKVLPLAGGAGFKMLRREVAILRRAKLPGIVEMIDDGMEGAHAFIAMRLVDGRDFPTHADRLPWEALAPSALRLLEALARLHWLGVLHRDLKPQNVLIDKDRRVTIVDLGIAWEGDGGAGQRATGAYTAGTPPYMSPECLRGRPPSVASDLYSVGVMLFEALAGRRLHPECRLSKWPEYVEMRCTAAEPRLAEAVAGVAPHVAAAVDAMLAHDPAKRPASAAAAAAMLRGDDDFSPHLRLPRVGGTAALDALVDAVKGARSVDVGGPRGSGRSRLLDDAAQRLAADGYLVVRTKPAQRPFESLAPVLGALPVRDDWSADQVRGWVERRLSLALSDGFIVFADDVASLDRPSADALAACRGKGRVVRVVDADAADIVLGPIAEADLRALFRGPDRIHHLREDGAHELFRRTRGVAAEVVRELEAWVEQGYARFEEALVIVDRMGLERLAWPVLILPPIRPELGEGLSSRERAIARLIAFAAGPVTPARLARAAGIPVWEMDLAIGDLVSRRIAIQSARTSVEAVALIEDPLEIEFAERLEIHAVLAHAMEPSDERRPFHSARAERWHEVVRDTTVWATWQIDRGSPVRAFSACIMALGDTVRRRRVADSEAEVHALATVLTQAAMSIASVEALGLALYHLSLLPLEDAGFSALRQVLDASRLGIDGDARRSLAALEQPLGHATSVVETMRHRVRMRSARLTHDGELTIRAIRDVLAWRRHVRTPEARSMLAYGTGWLRYRQGQYRRAMSLHERASRLDEGRRSRLVSRLNAASAAMEGHLYDEAERLACAAQSDAAALRLPTEEARSWWIIHSTGHRLGRKSELDDELVEVAKSTWLGGYEGLILLTEAATAFNGGSLLRARDLARAARDRLAAAAKPWPALLATALELAAGGNSAHSDDELLRLVQTCPLPGATVQVVALLGARTGRLSPEFVRIARVCAQKLEDCERRFVREVMSIDSAMDRILNYKEP